MFKRIFDYKNRFAFLTINKYCMMWHFTLNSNILLYTVNTIYKPAPRNTKGGTLRCFSTETISFYLSVGYLLPTKDGFKRQ